MANIVSQMKSVQAANDAYAASSSGDWEPGPGVYSVGFIGFDGKCVDTKKGTQNILSIRAQIGDGPEVGKEFEMPLFQMNPVHGQFLKETLGLVGVTPTNDFPSDCQALADNLAGKFGVVSVKVSKGGFTNYKVQEVQTATA